MQTDISKELMSVAWHPTRRWDWGFSENEKKRIELIFTNKFST